MAAFNYILGCKKDDGTYPVYLKIRHLNTNTMRSMDMSVAKSEWNSRGQEVAKILGVSVKELFKGDDTYISNNEMCGCIFFKGEMYTFNDRAELEKLLNYKFNNGK